MTLISDQYRILQARLHEERADYGISSQKHVEQIRAIAEQLKTHDILDYGCGKCRLARGLPFPIQNYDPAIDEYARLPDPAEFVVCTDVLEHIEPDCLDDVLAHLQSLTRKLLLVEVACRPAKKFLADGRNAHLIQETPNWWMERLLPLFDIYQFQSTGGAFVALFMAKAASAEATAESEGGHVD